MGKIPILTNIFQMGWNHLARDVGLSKVFYISQLLHLTQTRKCPRSWDTTHVGFYTSWGGGTWVQISELFHPHGSFNEFDNLFLFVTFSHFSNRNNMFLFIVIISYQFLCQYVDPRSFMVTSHLQDALGLMSTTVRPRWNRGWPLSQDSLTAVTAVFVVEGKICEVQDASKLQDQEGKRWF